jgi:hypothetical protein
MNRPIRSVETFFEDRGDVSIPRPFAEAAFMGAGDILQGFSHLTYENLLVYTSHLPVSKLIRQIHY